MYWLPESFNSPWRYMFNPNCIQLAPGWFDPTTLNHFQVQMSSKMSPELELFVVCGWGILVYEGWNHWSYEYWEVNYSTFWSFPSFGPAAQASVPSGMDLNSPVDGAMKWMCWDWDGAETLGKWDDAHWFYPERAWQLGIIGLSCPKELAYLYNQFDYLITHIIFIHVDFERQGCLSKNQ